MELDGKIVGRFGEAGKLLKEFGIGPRDRLPQRERDARRRAGELARAEADAEGADELDEVSPSSKIQDPNPNAPRGVGIFFWR